MTDVFISYSRKNALFADRLETELEKRNRTVWIDRDIRLTTEWWEEIKLGIEASDNFVLVMSPDSLSSPVCHLEIEYARLVPKRFIPVFHIEYDYAACEDHFRSRLNQGDSSGFLLELYGDRDPLQVFETNWRYLLGIQRVNASAIALLSGDGATQSLDEKAFSQFIPLLQKALDTDIAHVRHHTRLYTRMREWANDGRKPRFLLNGDETHEAEDWLHDWEQDVVERRAQGLLPKDPQPDDDLKAFITASRQKEDDRQRTDRERERRVRQLRRVSLLAGMVGSIAGILALVFYGVGTNAVNQVVQGQVTLTAVAAELHQQERRVEALRLVGEANTVSASDPHDPELAALLNIQSLNLTYSPQADESLSRAVAGLRLLRVWTPGSEGNSVNSVVFSPDGKWALAADAEGNVSIWDTQTGEDAGFSPLHAHTGNVMDVSYSPDGKRILTAGEDGYLTLWDAESGGNIWSILAHEGGAWRVAYSPDGTRVLSGGADDHVRLWDALTGAEILTYVHDDDVWSIVFNPTGTQTLSGDGSGWLLCYDLESQEMISREKKVSSTIWSVAFGLTGECEAAGNLYSGEDAINFDTAAGESRFTLGPSEASQASIYSIFHRPASPFIIAGDASGRIVELLMGNSGLNISQNFVGHQTAVYRVVYSSDESHILSAGADGTVRLWSRLGQIAPIEVKDQDYVSDVTISPDGSIAVVAGSEGLQEWHTLSDQTVRVLDDIGQVKSTAFSPDGNLIYAGSSDGVITQYRVDQMGREIISSDELYRDSQHRPITSLIPLTDGRTMFVRFQGSDAFLLNTGSGTTQPLPSELSSAIVLTMSVDGRVLIAGNGQDFALRLYNMQSATFTDLPSGANIITALDVSSDGRTALVGDDAGVLTLWDVEDRRILHIVTPLAGRITDVELSHDGRYAFGATSQGIVSVWDLGALAEVRRFVAHDSPITDATFSHDGRALITGGDDGFVRVWPVRIENTITYVCSRLTRDFTPEERDHFGISAENITCF